MTQEALVIRELSQGKALVSVSRKTACGGHCENCESCIVQSDVQVAAFNRVGAKAGEQVTIESRSSRIYKALLLVYVLPLVLLLAGYAIGSTAGLTEGLCIICALAGLGIGAWLVTRIGKKYRNNPITYSIIEVNQR